MKIIENYKKLPSELKSMLMCSLLTTVINTMTMTYAGLFHYKNGGDTHSLVIGCLISIAFISMGYSATSISEKFNSIKKSIIISYHFFTVFLWSVQVIK